MRFRKRIIIGRSAGIPPFFMKMSRIASSFEPLQHGIAVQGGTASGKGTSTHGRAASILSLCKAAMRTGKDTSPSIAHQCSTFGAHLTCIFPGKNAQTFFASRQPARINLCILTKNLTAQSARRIYSEVPKKTAVQSAQRIGMVVAPFDCHATHCNFHYKKFKGSTPKC